MKQIPLLNKIVCHANTYLPLLQYLTVINKLSFTHLTFISRNKPSLVAGGTRNSSVVGSHYGQQYKILQIMYYTKSPRTTQATVSDRHNSRSLVRDCAILSSNSDDIVCLSSSWTTVAVTKTITIFMVDSFAVFIHYSSSNNNKNVCGGRILDATALFSSNQNIIKL